MNKFRRDQVIAWGHIHFTDFDLSCDRPRRRRAVISLDDGGFVLSGTADFDWIEWNNNPRFGTLEHEPVVFRVGTHPAELGEVYEMPSFGGEHTSRFRIMGIGTLKLPAGKVIEGAIICQAYGLPYTVETFLIFRQEDWRVYDAKDEWRALLDFEKRQDCIWRI